MLDVDGYKSSEQSCYIVKYLLKTSLYHHKLNPDGGGLKGRQAHMLTKTIPGYEVGKQAHLVQRHPPLHEGTSQHP